MDGSDNAALRVHRALGSTARMDMLRRLEQHPQSVSDVAKASRLSVSMASRHLAILAAAGLIVRERNGGRVHHRVTAAGDAALRTWAGHAAEASSLASLAKAEAEAPDPADLTELEDDDVEFVLVYGIGAFAAGCIDRDRWIELLTQDLGAEWRGRLPTVWAAAMRLQRGESLRGLPLPAGVLANPPPASEIRPDMVGWVPARDA